MKRTPKNIFTEGPISTSFIAESIARHAVKTDIGGHSIFLGQVRADEIEGGHVSHIEYSAYTEMALQKAHDIREDIFARYPITCMHIHHSIGRVNVGEICLFVFTSSEHRRTAIEACAEVVERVKAELPVWGKEVADDNSHQWKKNTTE